MTLLEAIDTTTEMTPSATTVESIIITTPQTKETSELLSQETTIIESTIAGTSQPPTEYVTEVETEPTIIDETIQTTEMTKQG